MAERELEIKRWRIMKEFRKCPGCDYENGFHLMFRRPVRKESGIFDVFLICPKCNSTYDIGLKLDLIEKR
jgi:hypothetical protein